jgi:hypothetical protein
MTGRAEGGEGRSADAVAPAGPGSTRFSTVTKTGSAVDASEDSFSA